ncbi:MAG: hypothetical protein VB934_06395 [Polyangiaceae bacterium]
MRLSASIAHTTGPSPIHCRQQLVVTNVPTFGSVNNPTANDTLPWLEPVDSDDGPFSVNYTPHCYVDHPGACPGDTTETFSSVVVSYGSLPGSKSDPLLGGESGLLTVPDGGGKGVTFSAHYSLMRNGLCENPSDEVVWLRRMP